MIFVDTSVWIDFFRNKNSLVTAKMFDLLDNDLVRLAVPVKQEILSGCSAKNFSKVEKSLGALPVYYPQKQTWKLIEQWTFWAIKAGKRFSSFDLLIAGITKENEGRLWSLDSDFKQMAELKFIELYKY
jgi:hypothetical protein